MLLGLPRRRVPQHQAEWLEAGGLRFRALRAGHGDTTLVLLHGFGEHLLAWRGVVDPLARRHRVVAIDLPGFGGTDKPAGPYTLDSMVAWTGAFLDRWTLGPLILVGHSMGGVIATRLALDRPGRVVALVLIAPAGLGIGLADITEDMNESRAKALGWYEALRAFVTPLHDPEWLGEPEPQAHYDPTTDPGYRNATARVLTDFDFKGIGDRFRELRQPTLVIWGRLDPVIPYTVSERVLSLIPCARLATLDDALHRPQAERPDTVAALIGRFADRPTC